MAVTADITLPALEVAGYMGAHADMVLPDLQITAASSEIHMRTGEFPDYALTLPDLQIEAKMGERARLNEKLPTLSLVSTRTGARLDGKLPELAIEATCQSGQVARLDGKLPELQLTSRTASRADHLKLPYLTIDAQASTPVVCTLNKRLPTLSLVADIPGINVNLDATLPVLKIEATGSRRIAGTLDSKLPGLKISAHVLSGATATLDGTLPDLQIEAQSNSAIISLDAYLPQITTNVATGGDTGNTENVLSSSGRFAGTLLRYARWA